MGVNYGCPLDLRSQTVSGWTTYEEKVRKKPTDHTDQHKHLSLLTLL